jgi:hypothetical protein
MRTTTAAIASILLLVLCSLLLQACGANDDPFTVTNNTSHTVIDHSFFTPIPGTSNGGDPVVLKPGRSFDEPEDANEGTDPDRITSLSGKTLGCLPFQFSENAPKPLDVKITQMVRCRHWGYEVNMPKDWPNPNGATLQSDNLIGVSLSNSNLTGANLSGTDLADTDLSNADLYGVSGCSSTGTPSALPAGWEFEAGCLLGPGAQLVTATLETLNLSGDDLDGVNLLAAELYNDNLTGVSFIGANFYQVFWTNDICPDGTNSNNDGDTCVNNLG